MGRTVRGEAARLLAAAVGGGLVAALALVAAGLAGGGAAPARGAPAGEDVRAVHAAAAPAVVAVAASGRRGSGFVVGDGRHVVTSAHVVGADARVEVSRAGRAVTARLRGAEPSVDVAVLELEDPVEGARPLEFAAGEPRVGDAVVAIGAPFGLEGSVSTGVVSGLDRQIEAPNGFAITGAIQTDAALNPGNSGGPLLDMGGRVLGVATQIATEGGRNEGVGFAVPADVAGPAVEAIVATGRADLPYLGIVGRGAGEGVLLAEVIAGGPAASAGLRAGDLLTAVAGRRVVSSAGVADALAGRRPGDRVRVEARREGSGISAEVALGVRPPGGPVSP